MKPALRWILTEVWVDIFCFPWISRRGMGRLVDQIGNRKFAEYLQFYLHEWGKRTLEELALDEKGIFRVIDGFRLLVHVPQTAMPENIRFFKHITIQGTIGFLRLIKPLFDNVDVNLHIISGPTENAHNLRIIFPHFTSLLGGIHSIFLEEHAIPLLEHHFADKLDKIQMLHLYYYNFPIDQIVLQTSINSILNWLTSQERDCAEPRYFEAHCPCEFVRQFSAAIKKQFLDAKSPSTFDVLFIEDSGLDPEWKHFSAEKFHIENSIGEELNGNHLKSEGKVEDEVAISRHKANAGETLHIWNEKTIRKSDENKIIIFEPTIGYFLNFLFLNFFRPIDAVTDEMMDDGKGGGRRR